MATTNPSASDLTSATKMAKAEIIGNPNPTVASGGISTFAKVLTIGAGLKVAASIFKKKETPVTEVNIKSANGESESPDLRVRIRIPDDYYYQSLTNGPNNEIVNLKGIIFPYTPSISYDHKADYASSGPMHSNFGLNFYQRSSISNISISGKFTVQNDDDAGVYLATVHLLRALTKMRSGGESFSGAPPPVCRLDAYGDFMLKNVPVAINSYRVELPDSVDYFTTQGGVYGSTSVPTISTIAISCTPMYSRAEMQKFTVTGWLSDANLRKSGIL
jgi:hypothetical protein